MKRPRISIQLMLIASLMFLQVASGMNVEGGDDLQTTASRKAAIFIKNRAGQAFADKLGAFEDMLVGEISDMGFRVVSPEDTIKAVSGFAGGVPETEMDKALDDNTSATRLAQNMGVDYLIIVSITAFEKREQHLNRPDLEIDRRIIDHTLRATYKIVDPIGGDSVMAGNISTNYRIQQTAELSSTIDAASSLISGAAAEIAGKLKDKGGATAVPEMAKAPEMVNFLLSCSMQDLSVPEVTKDENGNLVLTGNRYNLEPLSVTVELDGVVIGTAPGEFQAAPGLHKLKLTREGFQDWERTVSVREGQALNVALTLTEEGRTYWLQTAEFFAQLKREERIAEADAELIKGVAQKMRQSGIRVDKKVDVKVDTEEAPEINQTNIDQQNVTSSVWP